MDIGMKALELARKEIASRRDRHALHVGAGRCKGIEDYRALTGRIAGLEEALGVLEGAAKQAREGDDDEL